jgi:peptidyl-prolyl cis-trans isomerase SDCCAG10
MSTVYKLEPPTKGKVLLHTTLGDLEIELWPKEAPKACRNFVQVRVERRSAAAAACRLRR